MIWKHLKSVGIELEGAWDTKRDDLVPDGSIRCDMFKNPVSYGEYVSKPFSNYEELINCVKENYPDETNPKSGMHSHCSFKTIGYYSLLMSKNFYEYFLSEMEKWAKDNNITNPLFWKRLEGNQSDYCAKYFCPEEQIKYKTKEAARALTKNGNQTRACHLNYCYGQHKTLENRLFPTFICVETAVSALTAYLTCIETFLEESCAKEKPIKVELVEEITDEDKPDTDEIVHIKPFKLELPPFSLFEKDKIYKKAKKEKKLDIVSDNQKIETMINSYFTGGIIDTGLPHWKSVWEINEKYPIAKNLDLEENKKEDEEF
jgi:hypothetical protein